MSKLSFTNPEIRMATAALVAITAIAPVAYYLLPISNSKSKSSYVNTFNKLLKAYSSLRPPALVADASKNFKHTILPAGLGLPSRTLEPFEKHAGMIFSLFEEFAMIPQANSAGNAVHVSVDTNTVTAHCKMGGKVNATSEMGQRLIASGIEEWWTECVLFVTMTGDGKKIVEVREFVHTTKSDELQKRLSGVLSK